MMKIISTKNVEHIAKNFAQKTGYDFIVYQKLNFRCGEIKFDFSDSIYQKDVVIFTSTNQFQEYFTETLLLICQIRTQKPRSIKLIICYFGYGRQEEVAQLLCKIFVSICDRVFIIDPHFKTQGCINISHQNIFEEYILSITNPIIILPDKGSIFRAQEYKIDKVILQKYRQSGVMWKYSAQNRNCIIIDDIIDSGETMKNAISSLHNYATLEIIVTHILKDYKFNVKVTSTNSIINRCDNIIYIEDVLIKPKNFMLLAN